MDYASERRHCYYRARITDVWDPKRVSKGLSHYILPTS